MTREGPSCCTLFLPQTWPIQENIKTETPTGFIYNFIIESSFHFFQPATHPLIPHTIRDTVLSDPSHGKTHPHEGRTTLTGIEPISMHTSPQTRPVKPTKKKKQSTQQISPTLPRRLNFLIQHNLLLPELPTLSSNTHPPTHKYLTLAKIPTLHPLWPPFIASTDKYMARHVPSSPPHASFHNA